MIIAIAMQKGGVGKTTSCICLGGILSLKKKCLLVDLDPQANLTTGNGVQLEEEQISAYDVITEQIDAESVIVKTNSGLDLLPADIQLAKGETEILSKVGNFFILQERLEAIAHKYDHILIDCPPSLGLLTINALTAADLVLIPVQCQFFALKGLAALLETIATIQKRLNPDLKILGALPTMAEKTIMSRDVIASLKQRLPGITIFNPVPKSIKFPESNLAGEPIHLYDNNSKLLFPYKAVAKQINEIQPTKELKKI